MAKTIKRTAASDFFAGMDAAPEPATKTEKPAITPKNTTDVTEATVSISLPKKSKTGKLVSFLANEGEYAEFSQIVKDLGYKKGEVFNQFIRNFIQANKK